MITVVVGGQYGGEGKGKISAYLALKEKAEIACRCGGPNSSHTVVWKGKVHRLRMMPTAAAVNKDIEVYFGPGTLIHVRTLFSEIKALGHQGRVRIDKRAGVVTDEIVAQQRGDERYKKLGSTLTGTGYASAMRCLRSLRLAGEFDELRPLVCDLTPHLMEAVAGRRHIIVEGHQGYGLSSYHGDYPYVSSRDSTAASMLAELGLGPTLRTLRVVLVAKMFPTRNHGGSLGAEIPLAEADKLGIREFGGGSWGIPDRRRRVGYIDVALLRNSAFANGATQVALTGADYFDRDLRLRTKFADLSRDLLEIIHGLNSQVAAPVRLVSTGPDTEATIEVPRQGKITDVRDVSGEPVPGLN